MTYDSEPGLRSSLENTKIRIMDIMHSSSVDGTGFRDVLFVNYCPHRCDGCHNPQSWDKKNGVYTTCAEVFADLTKSALTNVTFSGGEPFEQADELCVLARALREAGKTIWVYSGYTFEQLIADEKKKRLLEMCEVLVDGRYEKNNTELNMRFRGSLNQRIIDIAESLRRGVAVLYNLDNF